MSPHRKDFKRRRKSKFKYYRRPKTVLSKNTAARSLFVQMLLPPPNPMMMTTPGPRVSSGCSNTNITSKSTSSSLPASAKQFCSSPSSFLRSHATRSSMNKVTASTTTLPFKGMPNCSSSSRKEENMLSILTKDTGKVSQSQTNKNAVVAYQQQKQQQQSPSAIFLAVSSVSASGSDGKRSDSGSRLMSQPNEYYSKYSRNKYICSSGGGGSGTNAFPPHHSRRCQRQHSFQRTIITDDLQKMKWEHQLLVKLKMGQEMEEKQQRKKSFYVNTDTARYSNSSCCNNKTSCCRCLCFFQRAVCSNSASSTTTHKDNHGRTIKRERYYSCCCGVDSCTSFCICYNKLGGGGDSLTLTNMIHDSSNDLSQTPLSSTLSTRTTTTDPPTSTTFETTLSTLQSSSFSPFPSLLSSASSSISSKLHHRHHHHHRLRESFSSKQTMYNEMLTSSFSLPRRDLVSRPQNTSCCLLPINCRCFYPYTSKLAHTLLNLFTVLLIYFWSIIQQKTSLLIKTLIKYPSLPFHKVWPSSLVKSRRHLSTTSSSGKSATKKMKHASGITTKTSSVSGTGGHRFRSCQITRNKSDFIYIIALGLCLLSPSVTSVITSNAIFPMDSTVAHGDRDMDAEMSIPVEGVVGKRVEMPCDITPSRRDDTVYMVLWFRGEESIPIYSLDVRGKHVGGGKPWSAEKPFGKRAYFQSTSEPARLIVEGAKISDQGIYRCRVDFRNSPSREARLNLNITVPPNEPQIYDSTGMSIRGEVGPYLEGSNIELTCIVREGVPSPMVQWYLNDELVDSSYHVKEKEVINHMSVSNIQRSQHRASLSCRASNTLLVPPVTKTVYFELNLRPLSVSIPIKHRNPQLTAETQYEIKCESWGSHPPPVMTWWLDGREEKGAAIEESRGSNNSVSRLFFTPNASVDGQVLTCRAENPHVTAGALEDSWRLRVVYPPMLSLRMGSSLNPRDIKEGDDVYFECHIRANPQVHKLAWFHNGFLLHHNRSAGVILSNQSLVLQKVSRPSAGNYSCRASNVQGEGTSNHVLLDIMYAPACQTELSGTDAPIIIAASRSEDVNITCEMDALPDRLKFQWTHTNTVGENSELEPDMFSTIGSKSLLRYHLRSEEDFGTLLCWAHNSIGAAERPCVYQLVPADVPQPVENCSIINRTSTSVEITCEPGFDGGLPQSFLLEAYQTSPTERRGILYNLTLDRPTFSLSRLDTEGTFHFKIYSVNRKGRGIPSVMDGIVLRYPAMQSAKVRDLEKTTIAIIIGAGSAILLGVVSLIAFIIHRIRNPISSAELEKSYSREFGSTHRGSANGSELYRDDSTKKPGNPGMEIPFTATNDFDEDGDPDLIPTSKNVKAAAMGSVYSRLSNGEINQRYVAGPPTEKIPLRPMDPDLPISSMPPPCPTMTMDDPYTQGLPNYATFRGKPNGLGLKQRSQQQPRPMVSSSSTSFHGKSSTIVVNIDTRLIGQQLASNQLPESCV